MKVGEFYRNRFNHYVSQVTNVTDKVVTLTNVQGVSDNVKLENFRTNWSEVHSILQFETTIRNQFPDYFKIKYDSNEDTIVAEYDFKDIGFDNEVPYRIEFSIKNTNMISEEFYISISDNLKSVFGWQYSDMRYEIENALDAICMIADQL